MSLKGHLKNNNIFFILNVVPHTNSIIVLLLFQLQQDQDIFLQHTKDHIFSY